MNPETLLLYYTPIYRIIQNNLLPLDKTKMLWEIIK